MGRARKERKKTRLPLFFFFLSPSALSISSPCLTIPGFSSFHLAPSPPPRASAFHEPSALPPFQQTATMHSAVTRATAASPAAARPSAGAAVVAARPSLSVAASRRNVQTNAVKEVIMPALSSTMTEGKVSSLCAAGRQEKVLGRERERRGRERKRRIFALFVISRSFPSRSLRASSKPGKQKIRFFVALLSPCMRAAFAVLSSATGRS